MDYDYLEAVKADVRNYIEEQDYKAQVIITKERTREEAIEELYEAMWTEDSVTGNASGSYTFSTYKAEEYLAHNLQLLKEALEEIGDKDFLWKNLDNPEALDVTIRCYLLRQAIEEVFEEEDYDLDEY